MAVAVGHDLREQLMAQHQLLLALGRVAEPARGDLAVGAADADLERAQQQLARLRGGSGHLADAGRSRPARRGDERHHLVAAGAPLAQDGAIQTGEGRIGSLGTAELLLEARAVLAEGPRWDAASGRLLWVDIEAGVLHLLDPSSGADRALELGSRVGAAAPAGDGRVLAAVADRLVIVDLATGYAADLAAIPHGRADMRANDGICDAAGRFWFGTMGIDEAPTHRRAVPLRPGRDAAREADRDHALQRIGWSPDGRCMYYVDSPTQRIDAIDFEPESGALSNRRPWVTVPDDAGTPDGLAVDTEGGVWLALFGGGAVRRYRPDGELDGVLEIPAAKVTAACFGGPGGDKLFVTSASIGVAPEDQPLAGSLFVAETGFAGLPAHPFGG